MGRKATKAQDAETTSPESANGKPITKAEAIRRTIADGIIDSQAGVAHIKTQFGLDVSPGHFAASKSKEKNPAGETASAAPRRGRPPGKSKGVTVKVKRGRKPKAAVEGYLAPPAAPRAEIGEGDLLAAMEAMKPLVASLGVDMVKRIVDLLG